MYLKTT